MSVELKISLSGKRGEKTVRFGTALKEGEDYAKSELVPTLVLRIKKWLIELDREFDLEISQTKLDQSFRNLVGDSLTEAGVEVE